ncbi:MAG: helix-turn-helix transcriptional regulator [Planctomycetaceae bacterium]
MDSINRHEQVLRVISLIDILFGARHPLTTQELKDRLRARGVIDEMSDKNIRRDVEFLANFGYAVKQSKRRSPRGTLCAAWSIEPGKGVEELVAPSVTLAELLSLAVARDFLAPLAGTCYWRGIGQLMAKLEKVATPALIAYAESHKDGLVVHPRPAEAKYRARTLNAVNRAIRRTLELEIRYTSLADARPRRTTVRPEALVVYDGAIYIAAYRVPQAASGRRRDTAADAIRFYKLDRVADARVTSRTFTRRPEGVEELLADSITIYRSPAAPRRYRIRVDEGRARWAREKPFHPRQKVRELAGGAVILDIDRAWDEELIPQLLALGDAVEVLEPADVRQRLAEEAQRIVDRYTGRAVTATRGSRPA